MCSTAHCIGEKRGLKNTLAPLDVLRKSVHIIGSQCSNGQMPAVPNGYENGQKQQANNCVVHIASLSATQRKGKQSLLLLPHPGFPHSTR